MRQSIPLWLASASPRRKDILTTLGLTFRVEPSGASEEILPGELPADYVVRTAAKKADEVAAHAEAPAFVLGADTIVVVDGEILGKPDDDVHAASMLGKLAGRAHEVMTGVALARAGARTQWTIRTTTQVWMRATTADEIARYVASGDGRGKAGGYAVQGLASGLVTRIEGSYGNVVGLPAAETLELLVRAGALDQWP